MRFPDLLLAATLAVPATRERVSNLEHLLPRTASDSVIVSTSWLASHLHDPNVVVLQVNMARMHDARAARCTLGRRTISSQPLPGSSRRSENPGSHSSIRDRTVSIS